MTDTMQAVIERLSKVCSEHAEAVRNFASFLEENRVSQSYRKNTMKSLILFSCSVGNKRLLEVDKGKIRKS